MSFAFGRPSCGRALRCVVAPKLRTCVGPPNLRTCLALRTCVGPPNLRTCLALRTCVGPPNLRTCLAFVLRTCVGPPNLRTCREAVLLQAKICSYPSSSSSFSLVLPCVDAFVEDEFCVWAPILRTCLALRWGAQLADVPCVAFGRPSCGRALGCVGAPNLGEAVLKRLPPSQNLFLSILQLVF
jgi:hypothetical protein